MPIGNFSPPPPQDRRIRIRELEQRGTTPHGCRQWKVSISCGTYHAVVNLADPFTASQETRLRWALEEHPIRHPFESYKSRAASKELWGYSVSLVDQLNLHEVLTYPYPEDVVGRRSFTGHYAKSSTDSSAKGTRRRRWYVDIEECWGGVAESVIHGLHWEALENPEIWPSHMRPCLIVRRKVLNNDILTHGPIIAIRSQSFRILLVVSHPLRQGAPNQTGGRLIAKPLVHIIGQLMKETTGATTPIQLEIVRPGTWKSLQDHLKRRGKGYFHLVHFVVHGKVTHDKVGKRDLVSLAFVSDHSSRKRSWRPATEVSALLSTYGVKLVVLNASRSAKASGACEANIAETFVQGGVRAVIAFPYKVLNSGTEVFMSTFYRCFLAGSWNFATALSEARRAMMKMQLREGRFGIKVSVEDWIVPVVYHSGGTEVSVVGDDIGGDVPAGRNDSKGIFSKFQGLLQANSPDPKSLVTNTANRQRASLISRGTLTQGEIVGRDGDIFNIEAMLGTSILRVVGPPGIGKSTLILHLCWWWKTTSLVQDCTYFDWYEKPYLNVEMIARELYLSLFPLGPENGSAQKPTRNRSPIRGALLQAWSRPRSPSPAQSEAEIFPHDWFQKTLSRLRETPYLIVFDSLESSDATVKHNERLKGELNEFLESLQGGRTIVLVVSNKQECWLNDSTVKFGTYHLKRLEESFAIEFAGKAVDRYGGDRKRFRGAENQKYLHKLMKLSEMNPLVMDLTLPYIAIHDDSPQTIFISLLQGAIPLGAAHDTKAMYNMAELLGRLDNVSRQLLLCLAPFWTRLPKDIDPYLHSLLYHKALPGMVEIARQHPTSRRSSEREKQRAKSIVSSTGLLLRYSYIVRDLLSLELLSDSDTADSSDPSSTPSSQYYRVHPLLTLFLRQTVQKEQASSETTTITAVKRAFLDYYAQRSAYWFEHPEETYDLAAQEIREEEINFLSVISIPFQNSDPKKLFETFPLDAYSRFASMTLVDKELSSSVSLIVHFSDLILQRFEELRAKRGDRKVHESAVEIALFASNWLCEYHSENSPVSVFRAQIERSTRLMAFANNISPDCQDLFAVREEQATKQKSVAVSDGMIEGLRLRKPWNGFMISHVSRDAMAIWEAKGDSDGVWLRLALEFSRLQSIAVQAPLAIRFSPALGEQLRKDLKLIWEDCIKSAIGTDIEPFLANYKWVTVLLAKTRTKADENSSENKPHIHSARFTGYPEFVRSQLMLQIRDTTSAKRYLLDGLQRARTKSNHSAEVLLHIRLSDLTFELRNWNECIAHVEWIRDIMVRLGEGLSTVDFKAFAQATWRKGVCHSHLHQWDAAIEAFNEALSVCGHIDDRVTEYAILRKLAAIKREGGLGELTVTEALLKALSIAYDPNLIREFAIIDEHGILLQRIVSAMARKKAGESAQSVIARLACARDTSGAEMHEFVEELMTREKEIVTVDSRAGVPLHKTEKKLTKLYAEAERIMFNSPRVLAKQPLSLFAGSKWERGLLKRECL